MGFVKLDRLNRDLRWSPDDAFDSDDPAIYSFDGRADTIEFSFYGAPEAPRATQIPYAPDADHGANPWAADLFADSFVFHAPGAPAGSPLQPVDAMVAELLLGSAATASFSPPDVPDSSGEEFAKAAVTEVANARTFEHDLLLG